MTLTRYRTNKEPNNQYISAPSRQHNWVVPFLQQSQPDTPLSDSHCRPMRSASSNPQLHIPGQTGLHSHPSVQEYLQDPSPSATRSVQDRRSEPPLSRNNVRRALEFVMLQWRRDRGRRRSGAGGLRLRFLRLAGVEEGAEMRQGGRPWRRGGRG